MQLKNVNLRPYQQEIVDKIVNKYNTGEIFEVYYLLVNLPVGIGKSLITLKAIQKIEDNAIQRTKDSLI